MGLHDTVVVGPPWQGEDYPRSMQWGSSGDNLTRGRAGRKRH